MIVLLYLWEYVVAIIVVTEFRAMFWICCHSGCIAVPRVENDDADNKKCPVAVQSKEVNKTLLSDLYSGVHQKIKMTQSYIVKLKIKHPSIRSFWFSLAHHCNLTKIHYSTLPDKCSYLNSYTYSSFPLKTISIPTPIVIPTYLFFPATNNLSLKPNSRDLKSAWNIKNNQFNLSLTVHKS